MMGYVVKMQKPASYQGNSYGSGTIGSSGCGPSALCNALANANIADVSVPTMCKLAVSCGARQSGGTVESTLLKAAGSKYGFTYRSTSKNAELLAHLKAGGTAVCYCGGNYPLFSVGGHYVAAVGVDSSGRIVIADSLYYANKWTYNSTRRTQITTTGTRGLVKCSLTALGKATADRSPSYFLIGKARTSTTEKGKDVSDMTEADVRKIIESVATETAKKTVSAWAEKAWSAATQAGVMDGTAPQANVTREQLAQVFVNVGLIGVDNTPSDWAAQAFTAATDAGILDGTNPHGLVTREQLAQAVVNAGLIGPGQKANTGEPQPE